MTYDEALRAIKEGRARAHAMWMLLASEDERQGFGLRPATWEGPGEYQRVTLNDRDDLGFLVKLPTFKHLPIQPIKKSVPAKHTPGPWKTENASNPGEFANVYGGNAYCGNNRPVAALYIGNPDAKHPDAEDLANARAIAAVPDLIAALEALLAWGRNHTSPTARNSPHRLLIDAHVALEKARGEVAHG